MNCDPNHGPNSESGTTLVELLVALALLSLMIVYALGALGYLRTMDQFAAGIETQSAVEAVAQHMRQSIADARITFERTDGETTRIVFKGDPTALELVSVLNDELATGGLFVLRYEAGGQGTFSLKRRLHRTELAAEVVLLDGIKNLRFRYFGAIEAGGEASWLERWPVADRLPMAVAVTVTFPESDSRRWPETVIGLAAAR